MRPPLARAFGDGHIPPLSRLWRTWRRPDIVWFGEIPYHMEHIQSALENSDLFVALGTSGNVYPAAGFSQMAQRLGIRTVELNLAASGAQFDEVREGPASEIVPLWVEEILNS